jgi:hypothetical protein
MPADQFLHTIEIKDRTGRVVGTKEVVTYQGLLSKAHEEGLKRVTTSLLQIPSPDNAETAIVKAEVETGKGVFEGIGDASPKNVNSFIVPHLIRMAETRAKARALRDAVNIGVVSFEELDGEALAMEGSDLGSGAHPSLQSRVGNGSKSTGRAAAPGRTTSPMNGTRPTPTPSRRAPSAPTNGRSPDPMSDSQRRYVYRLVASRGVSPASAEAFLADHFGIENFGSLSRFAATKLIDALLAAPREEVTAGGGD